MTVTKIAIPAVQIKHKLAECERWFAAAKSLLPPGAEVLSATGSCGQDIDFEVKLPASDPPRDPVPAWWFTVKVSVLGGDAVEIYRLLFSHPEAAEAEEEEWIPYIDFLNESCRPGTIHMESEVEEAEVDPRLLEE